MTRIITEYPTIEQLDQFERHLNGDDPQWIGTDFGLNLKDLLAYARDGLKIRDENIAYGDEMERREVLIEAWNHSKECVCDVCADAKALLPEEEFDPWEENNYALQLEGRAYGPHNPENGPKPTKHENY